MAPAVGPLGLLVARRGELALDFPKDPVGVLVASARVAPSELGPVEATCQDLGVAAAALFFRGPLTAVAIPVHLIAGPLDRLAAALLGREFRDSAAVAELGQDADVLRLDRARADAVVIEGSTLEPEAHFFLLELEATVVAPARALSAHVVLDPELRAVGIEWVAPACRPFAGTVRGDAASSGEVTLELAEGPISVRVALARVAFGELVPVESALQHFGIAAA
mmetsp:Transcript_16108/g.38579  ORF Transcript_16108/g.38579 Transcript_16108/m.38579 type:complete len:223 (+) Transcript_16108:795-1463(+)